MSNFKVGDRVWHFGDKSVILDIIRGVSFNIRLRDIEDGYIAWVCSDELKPIVKIKNGEVYE